MVPLIEVTFVIGDPERGKVPEDLVRRGIAPDSVLIVDDLPVPEADALLAVPVAIAV